MSFIKNILCRLSVICLLFCSCNETSTKDTNVSVSTTNNSLLEQIDIYRNEHPEVNSILVLSDIDANWWDAHKTHNYWIIGPAYKGLSYVRGGTSFFFKYKNSMIFLQSSLDGLIDSLYAKKIYYQNSINISSNKEEIEELFYKKAIVCKQDSNGTFSFVSNEVKKRVFFTAPTIK